MPCRKSKTSIDCATLRSGATGSHCRLFRPRNKDVQKCKNIIFLVSLTALSRPKPFQACHLMKKTLSIFVFTTTLFQARIVIEFIFVVLSVLSLVAGLDLVFNLCTGTVPYIPSLPCHFVCMTKPILLP